MRNLFLGTILGIILGIAIVAVIGAASASSNQPKTIINCFASVGHGSMRPGAKCMYSDEVMTGFQDGYAYCAKIYVNCTGTK